jgi:hypothetical protein
VWGSLLRMMEPGLPVRATCTRLASPAAPLAAALCRPIMAIWSRSILGRSRASTGSISRIHWVDLQEREHAADPAFRFAERVLELSIHEHRGPSLAVEHAREDGLHPKQPDVYEHVGVESG